MNVTEFNFSINSWEACGATLAYLALKESAKLAPSISVTLS